MSQIIKLSPTSSQDKTKATENRMRENKTSSSSNLFSAHSEHIKTQIENTTQDALSDIFSYLHLSEKSPVATTSKQFYSALKINYQRTKSLKIKPGHNILEPGPNIQKLLTPYIRGHLNKLDLNSTNITIEDLEFITKNFPKLEHLNLGHCCQIIDEIEKLASLTSLQHLNLEWCEITDNEIEKLVSLTSLQYLNLEWCLQITYNGIKKIADSFTNLKHLDFSYCPEITDFGIEKLVPLTSLQHLNLTCCSQITDTGIEKIAASLTNLQYLNLSGCSQITDAGIEEIGASLTKLQYLEIEECVLITNAGIEKLAPLANLQHLFLNFSSKITDAGIALIKRSGLRIASRFI